MPYFSLNPFDNSLFAKFDEVSDADIELSLARSEDCYKQWRYSSFSDRSQLLMQLAQHLRENKLIFAKIITEEMGKLIHESLAEVEKCAVGCEYYAKNGASFLKDEHVKTEANKSLIAYQPLGVVFLVMPWNFPFWQVFRCASAAIMAGNTVVLKHASNVPRCALAIQQIFADIGAPQGILENLLVSASRVASIITDKRIKSVALTGSEEAGRSVAAAAGRSIKPSLLELGGSDAFVVLADADINLAVQFAVKARFMNAGQSCIAAKRFIIVEQVADRFVELFSARVGDLKVGDPMSEKTSLAPLARKDLLIELHGQVVDALGKGGRLVCGGNPVSDQVFADGNFYLPTIIDKVVPQMRIYNEEVFGPVASIIRVKDADQALTVANDSLLGLGGCVWTQNLNIGEKFVRNMECGAAFVNNMVKSDPRLPFGGIKESGYGRELSSFGIRQFVNVKTISISV